MNDNVRLAAVAVAASVIVVQGVIIRKLQNESAENRRHAIKFAKMNVYLAETIKKRHVALDQFDAIAINNLMED